MAGKSSAARPGRPSTLVADEATLRSLEELGMAQSPLDEVAGALRVDRAEVERLFQEEREARLAYEAGRAAGLKALRLAQLKMAETSVPMATLLGKAYLGHVERRENDETAATPSTGALERVRSKIAAIAAQDEPA
jgi:hypothetical protein